MRMPRRAIRPVMERLDARSLPSGFTAAQLTHAYGLDAIMFTSTTGQTVAGNGAGEVIALIEAYHDPNLASDLHVFDQANGLDDPALSVVNQAGTRTNDVWASEEVLDVEWAHAIAPGASILVVEARSDSLGDLMTAVDTARNTPGVASVSMSWGFGEMPFETSYDGHFQTPVGHQGITFLAASGDNGTAGGPSYPSTSPQVVAVGGTTLSADPNGNYLGEVAWSGSGGGYSRYESEPAYQATVQATGRRTAPDVAFLGDPNTGVAVYETPPQGSQGSWIEVGGTSLGTPAWAAIIAIVDQGRAVAGKGSLDGATQTLPALYGLPSSDFHPVPGLPASGPVGGGFNFFGFSPHRATIVGHGRRKAANALPGANIATGLGSPVAPALVRDLVASDLTQPMAKYRGPHGRRGAVVRLAEPPRPAATRFEATPMIRAIAGAPWHRSSRR